MPMIGGSTSRFRARMAQRVLLLVGALLFLGGLFWLCLNFPWSLTPAVMLFYPVSWLLWLLHDVGVNDHPNVIGFIISGTMYLGLFIFAESIFLWPHGKWRLALAGQGRPLRGAAIGAGLMGMLLSIAFIATIMEIPSWPSLHTISNNSLWSLFNSNKWGFFTVLGVMLVLWAVWAILFFRYWRGANQLPRAERVIRWLVAGSILEVLVASVVQAFTPGERDGYYAKGSYTGLVFGGTALIWLFGPGILFIGLREYQRRKADGPATV